MIFESKFVDNSFRNLTCNLKLHHFQNDICKKFDFYRKSAVCIWHCKNQCELNIPKCCVSTLRERWFWSFFHEYQFLKSTHFENPQQVSEIWTKCSISVPQCGAKLTSVPPAPPWLNHLRLGSSGWPQNFKIRVCQNTLTAQNNIWPTQFDFDDSIRGARGDAHDFFVFTWRIGQVCS